MGSSSSIVVGRVSSHVRVDRGRKGGETETTERHCARSAIPREDRARDETGIDRVVDVVLCSELQAGESAITGTRRRESRRRRNRATGGLKGFASEMQADSLPR